MRVVGTCEGGIRNTAALTSIHGSPVRLRWIHFNLCFGHACTHQAPLQPYPTQANGRKDFLVMMNSFDAQTPFLLLHKTHREKGKQPPEQGRLPSSCTGHDEDHLSTNPAPTTTTITTTASSRHGGALARQRGGDGRRSRSRSSRREWGGGEARGNITRRSASLQQATPSTTVVATLRTTRSSVLDVGTY